MQLKTGQLTHFFSDTSHVAKYRLIWIHGDEPVLVDENAAKIRQSAQQVFLQDTANSTELQEPITKDVLAIDSKFEWQEVRNRTQQASIFSTQQFLDLRLYINKIPPQAVSILTEFASAEKPDHFLLITSPRIDSKQVQSSAFKKLIKHILIVPVWPLKKMEYIQWLKQKAITKNLTFDPKALNWFAQQTEGNLLTAVQTIEQLSVIRAGTDATNSSNPVITLDILKNQLSYSARLNIFDILLQVYLGDLSQLTHQVNSLKAESQLPVRLLAAIQKELQVIAELKEAQTNNDLESSLKRLRVFGPKQQALKSLIRRITVPDLMHCFSLGHQLDRSIKGASNEDSWELLIRLLMHLGGLSSLRSVTQP